MSNADYLSYGTADFALAPYGPHWKFMKKLCMTELLGGQTLEHHLPVRCDELKRFLHLLYKKAKANEAVDVGAELITLTNNMISRMALRKRFSENEDDADKVRKIVKEMCGLAGKGNVSEMIWFCKNLDLQGFGKRLKDVRDRYDTMMEKIMKEHEEARRKEMGDGIKDVLDILLDIYEDENSEIRMTRENIKAFIMNMFGAGTNTSAVTTEWGLSELINHPKVMDKARQEIDMVIGKNKIVEESDIVKLPYMQAIVKEILRLHPTGPLITRECTEDCNIAGYDIPAKTRVYVNVWAIGRDSNHWENPLEFSPERFLIEEGSGNSQLDVREQHFHFIPFGSGRRSCPGATLALKVVHTTLAAMIQCFEWKLGMEEMILWKWKRDLG
ncbi:3,9-dihydroxypterocarpan 6A-monooxygenase [Quercus suber]|uniref:3,9-dihydroxypterocarpan 6A-monooxygenase n=1 Tax=Quercus suber TaxID=58331 RepID=UPI0032DF17F7